MSDLFEVKNTSGVLKLSLAPGSSTESGFLAGQVDLKLYGPGHPRWGEGFNENFYRLLETNACPESILNPGKPMTSVELGIPNAGINNPVVGQMWYNTTNSKAYVCSNEVSNTWMLVSGASSTSDDTAPNNPNIGDLWYDTITDILYVWNGTTWIETGQNYLKKTGGTMISGYLTLANDPTSPMHAATRQWVIGQVSGAALGFTPVNKDGDTMNSGKNLTFQGGGTVKGLPNPSASGDAVSLSYLQANYRTDTLSTSRYLRKDASDSSVGTITAADFKVGVNSVWHAGNFNPASKQNALGYTPVNKAGDSCGTLTFLAQNNAGEGGEIHLQKSAGGSSLTGDLIIDLVGNSVRMFEGAPPYRGAYLDILSCVSQSVLAAFNAQSVGTNPGYVMFQNGLKVQWGTSASVGLGEIAATYPIAFASTATYSLFVYNIGNTSLPVIFSNGGKMTTGFSGDSGVPGSSSGVPYNWFAIGY